MQYYDIHEGDFHLTSDGLNIWFYTINSNDVKEPYDGYSSDLISLKNNIMSGDRDYPKKIIKLIEKMARIEEEALDLIESVEFDSIRNSFNEHVDKDADSKEVPRYAIDYQNYSIVNDGTVVWAVDNDIKGDNRVSGWTTSYPDVLRSFLIHKMNTERTMTESDLLKGFRNDVKIRKSLIENDMTDVII